MLLTCACCCKCCCVCRYCTNSCKSLTESAAASEKVTPNDVAVAAGAVSANAAYLVNMQMHVLL